MAAAGSTAWTDEPSATYAQFSLAWIEDVSAIVTSPMQAFATDRTYHRLVCAELDCGAANATVKPQFGAETAKNQTLQNLAVFTQNLSKERFIP
ncbi:hypothetical protein DRO19_00435 [Candidatus Bathyarchaeota archaeon]|nr:MAG: hypothetical protein DRO19_00435 [Candidatus Bathyarchaeota archaeon]